MFVLQTTIAVLICFLAIVAYNNISAILARKSSPRRDSESDAGHDLKTDTPNLDEIHYQTAQNDLRKLSSVEEMEKHKQLYHKLHNLERHPEILAECHDVLVSLFAETLSAAMDDPSGTILSLQDYSKPELEQFLAKNHTDATDGWEAYIARRKAGGQREMFENVDEAKWWLRQAAPVKYVDGAWLGHINKIATPFNLRSITKNAWQVMSEELGDGDLNKNHIQVYRNLMREIGAGLPDADDVDLIHSRHGLDEARVWKAAVAQLLVSLFPHEFLPEILGFNMAYETLPLHLMKTTKELNELKLNSYYFVLHISIDNSDSGHAAMAMTAASDYIEHVAAGEGEECARAVWRRIQTGFTLAEGLPTTPVSKTQSQMIAAPFPSNDKEAAVINIFKAKVKVAQKLHCNSRVRIGRHTLIDWLDPVSFSQPEWQRAFLDDLGNCRPWVYKGDSEKSRLSRELSWEGKMFGSFTQAEVEAVKCWIDSLSPSPGNLDHQIYHNFVRTSQDSRDYQDQQQAARDVISHYPVFSDARAYNLFKHSAQDNSRDLSNPLLKPVDGKPRRFDWTHVMLSWFTSGCLLEGTVNVPVRVSTQTGSAIVTILRAQYGYDFEGPGVAGIDELTRTNQGRALGLVEIGLDVYRKKGLQLPRNLHDVLDTASIDEALFAREMLDLSMRHLENEDALLGITWAFMELHELLDENTEGWLSPQSMTALHNIVGREKKGLKICLSLMKDDESRLSDFWSGCSAGRLKLRDLLLCCSVDSKKEALMP